MADHPQSAASEVAELRTCLRDLVGLLGLPALWSGGDTDNTVRVLAQTLAEVLSLDACWVSTALVSQDRPCCYLYANGAQVEPEQAGAWAAFTRPPSGRHLDLQRSQEPTPLGELRIVRFSLAYYGHQGLVTVGSVREDFPTPMELVLLRSAASLAASGLRTAQLTYERERALRAKDEFLAMLGHELRNPLAPIVAALNLMRMRGDGRLTPEYTIINRQVSHLTALVDDLLDVTRITRGKIELTHELLETRSFLDAAVEIAQPLIAERQHRLIVDAPQDRLPVTGDARRLAQAISNLLINAAKYTDPGGRIALTATRRGGEVVIRVTDSGIGIGHAMLPHVFDLFEQGKVDIARSRGGLGIGLSVVKTLVTMHGGAVKADSEGHGMGSTFTVTLPLAQAAAPIEPDLPREPEIALPPRCPVRIILVDDNRDAADILGELLHALGHEVHIRYAPEEVLALCEDFIPDVVILDIGLPGMSGYELAQTLRARLGDQSPRMIAVSGYGQAQDRTRSQQAGITAHLTKPVQIETLMSHLHHQPAAG